MNKKFLFLMGVFFSFSTLFASPFAYVPNTNSNTVSVIDTATNMVVSAVGVGTYPLIPAITPDGSKVYVINNTSNNVSVIRTSDNMVIATIPVGFSPIDIRITPNGSKVYVINQTGQSYSAIDTATQTVIATVPFSSGIVPVSLSITPNGSKVYISTVGAAPPPDNVYVVNAATATISSAVPVGIDPLGITFLPNGTRAYVANSSSDTITVIDVGNDSIFTTISLPAGAAPLTMVSTPTGAKLYVEGSSNVFVIDTATNSLIATIPVSLFTTGPLAMTPDGSKVYVGNTGGTTVTVISTTSDTVIGTVITGSPRVLTVTSDGSKVYVSNFVDNTVSVISTLTDTVIATIPVGFGPWSIAIGSFSAPTNGTGNQVGIRYLKQTDLVNELSWLTTSDASAQFYEIYRNGLVIATLPTTGALQRMVYHDHNRTPGVVTTYQIVAFDGGSGRSSPLIIIVP